MRASPVNIGEVKFTVVKKEKGKDGTDRYDIKAINAEGKLEKLILFPYYVPHDKEGGIFSTGITSNKKYKADNKRKSMPLFIDTLKEEEEAFAEMLELINQVISTDMGFQVKGPGRRYKKNGVDRKSV